MRQRGAQGNVRPRRASTPRRGIPSASRCSQGYARNPAKFADESFGRTRQSTGPQAGSLASRRGTGSRSRCGRQRLHRPPRQPSAAFESRARRTAPPAGFWRGHTGRHGACPEKHRYRRAGRETGHNRADRGRAIPPAGHRPRPEGTEGLCGAACQNSTPNSANFSWSFTKPRWP